ncbi:hypothetical protein KY284_034003 [Solanum tuberosum]|nr:hypothetical protein KY284_034003 [Solanum tuberosum]
MAPLPGPYSGTSTLALSVTLSQKRSFTRNDIYLYELSNLDLGLKPSLTRKLKLRHITDREQYAAFAV